MPFGKENEHEAAPGASETAGSKNAPPAAGAPGAAPAAAPAGGSPDIASIGQALKHIAMCLERIESRMGMEGDEGAAPTDGEADGGYDREDGESEEREGAMDEEGDTEEEGEENERREAEQARDADLTGAEPATKEITINGGRGSEGRDGANGGLPMRDKQEGTGARGNPTPHGAMDARAVRRTVDTAVANAVKQERVRFAAVEQAKRDVRGVLGEVYGMDSASKIYREALVQIGADVAAIPKGGEKAAWTGYVQGAGAAAGARRQPAHAMDGKEANSTGSKLAALVSKISVKG